MKISKLLIILFSLNLMACDPFPDATLNTYIQKVKARTRLKQELFPQIQSLANYLYPENEERSNPFRPKKNNFKRKRQALEQFSLEALSFVGVIKQDFLILALIKRPDGEVSLARLGDYMGKNKGKIISIKENFLQLEEKVFVAGEWTKEIKDIVLNSYK